MALPDYSGYWTGRIEGTNNGGFTLDMHQEGDRITGTAHFHEPAFGLYEYSLQGTVAEGLSVRMSPGRHSGLSLGIVQVVGSMRADGQLVGRWKSDIETEGAFTAKRFEAQELSKDLPANNSVFLVHGHDEGAKHAVARFLEQIGVAPVILQEQINRGMTIIEKFEQFAARAGFAVVLMTPDDHGYPVGKEQEKKLRPRQNVILELGYFAARLGRPKTLVLMKGQLEVPSDVLGLVYESMDSGDGWKMRLASELKAAGFRIDLNKALS